MTNNYEKKYTDEALIKVLEDNPQGIMLGRIQTIMGCSEMTTRNLLNPLLNSGVVEKRNIGSSEKKPINLYFLKK